MRPPISLINIIFRLLFPYILEGFCMLVLKADNTPKHIHLKSIFFLNLGKIPFGTQFQTASKALFGDRECNNKKIYRKIFTISFFLNMHYNYN